MITWTNANGEIVCFSKPRQPGRSNPARGKPGGAIKPKKGKGSYDRKRKGEL